jgi:hypothetical protein
MPLRHNGHNQIVFRTLFGNTTHRSPRLFRCPCQSQTSRTFSPLSELFQTRSSPERLYLETKWAALISFALTAQLLAEVLPVDRRSTPASVRNNLQRVASRAEAALGEERGSFLDGCPRDWAALPRPPAPLTVGIDGGYVRAWEAKQTHVEVIAGKSMPEP